MLLNSYYPCSCRGNTSTARGAVRGTGCRGTCAGSEDRAGALHPIVQQDWEGGQGKKYGMSNKSCWPAMRAGYPAPGTGESLRLCLAVPWQQLCLGTLLCPSPCKGFSWQKLQGQREMESTDHHSDMCAGQRMSRAPCLHSHRNKLLGSALAAAG